MNHNSEENLTEAIESMRNALKLGEQMDILWDKEREKKKNSDIGGDNYQIPENIKKVTDKYVVQLNRAERTGWLAPGEDIKERLKIVEEKLKKLQLKKHHK